MNYHRAKYGHHKHSTDGGDIMFLVCDMILQDYGNKGLSNFMGGSHSRQVSILPSLMNLGTMVVEI